jgi:hypothetical protein
MVPPDYQEFANRGRARCRDNSVICRACATRRNRKTAQRCAIVTPLQEHESGTFDQRRQRVAAGHARIYRKTAAFALI